MPRTSRIFHPKIEIFLNYTPDKIINLLLIDHFYPAIPHPTSSKRKIIVYGSVTRCGPQSVASASG